MSKFLGFLLGVAVALAGPAVFGVLAAPGGIELNAKEMALAYGIGALIFWTVVSYFSGAGALGAFLAFGTLIYCWLWIPNRTTNFLNDVPGVTNGMIDGSKQYTLNGVVPILAVISLVYGIQLIVQGAQRRKRERAEAERLQQEQEAVQAQQEADAAALYPVAGSTYPGQYAGTYESRSRFDDLFDEDPEPVRPRSQADEQTAQFPAAGPAENTAQFRGRDNDAEGNEPGDDTVLVPTDRDETTQVPAAEPQQEKQSESAPVAEPSQPPMAEDEQVTQVATSASAPAAGAAEQETQQVPVQEAEQATQQAPASEQRETQQVPVSEVHEPEAPASKPEQAAPVDEAEPETQQVPVQTGQQAETEERPEEAKPAGPQTPSGPTAGAQAPRAAGAAGAAAAGAAWAAAGQSGAAEPSVKGEGQASAPEAGGDEPKPAEPKAAGPQASGGQTSAPQAGGDERKLAGPQAASGQAAAPEAPGGVPEGKGERAGTPPVPEVGERVGTPPVPEVGERLGTAPVPGVREQVGSQYRERMDDPEDTGEFFISAFENPPVVDGPGQIRAAGA
ncbi:hypothetical protein E0H75_14345 [Kribbella capetownensis]|uniref:Uncharacterized protein n=1 Tax=Kribbella capetownensis TaxID=1572659 RepID=A0A4R0K0R3_9ACTN|nr:hypothetical protein [Kribbella capetownensis]TCC51296.1 hypothetical protein E0H75_14345 [Kribbella capetownensis]